MPEKRTKANFHTHTTWCDGEDAPEAVVVSAIEKGFAAIGFSSHVSSPEKSPTVLDPYRGPAYAVDIRRVQVKFADRIKVFLGVEADYVPGVTAPGRTRYALDRSLQKSTLRM